MVYIPTASTSQMDSPSTKKPFSPSNYLQGLGWTPGKPLTSAINARSKPITVAHKKNLAGLGKDRDTSYNWWEKVFENVAEKVIVRDDRSRSEFEFERTDRTSTGLISHLPPRPKPRFGDDDDDDDDDDDLVVEKRMNQYSGVGGFNQDAIATAKMEMARKQLYTRFLRGKALGATVVDQVVTVQTKSSVKESEGKSEKKRRRKEEKESRKGTDRRKEKKKKRVDPSIDPVHLSPEESINSDESAYDEAREIAKMARKEEKRLQKIVKANLKAKAQDSDRSKKRSKRKREKDV